MEPGNRPEAADKNVNDSPFVIESLSRILEQVETCSALYCIYRVPAPLRSACPKAYTPKVISIGPLHHNTKGLVANTHKGRYLHDLLIHMNLNLKGIIQCLTPLVPEVRRCYAEPIEMPDDEFLELLVLDGCFVVMYIIGSQFPQFRDKDRSFLWRFGNEILCDLMLLENQLPFKLLDGLYYLCKASSSANLLQSSNFTELASKYFSDANNGIDVRKNNEINHFVDLLRMNFIRSCSQKQPDVSNSFRHSSIWPPTATELHNCGVSFKMKSKNTMDIEFIERDSILELPQIILSETFKIQLKNFIAYEQCHGSRLTTLTNDVCSFAFFLSYLINTKKDMRLLIHNGIVQNNLANIDEATIFFTKLCKKLPIRSNMYNIQCERMKNHCKRRRHRWMTLLRRNYFNSPWAFISFFVAALLFVLTLLQAVMAFVALQK